MTYKNAPLVRVKHLVEYLSSLNQEAIVDLTHDGWLPDQVFNADGSPREMPEKTALEIVATRGLFHYSENAYKQDYLLINN
jgi:hypothetical protein